MFVALLGWAVVLGTSRDALCQDDPGVSPDARHAIDRALAFLAARRHDDGSFGRGTYRGDAGVTSLAALAFMACGSTPGKGPHGEIVAQSLDYILSRARPDGFIVGGDTGMHRPMYGHGFSVLLLAECAGMSSRTDLRRKLDAGVKVIVGSQNEEGGWRYTPKPDEADISVTVCQLTALRAAQNAGVGVPKETIDRAVAYIRKCQNADGGFMYRLPEGPSAAPRTAAAFVGLFNAGFYEQDILNPAVAYLQKTPIDASDPYYFYAQYYQSQAMRFHGGPYLTSGYPKLTETLLAAQSPDGGWQSTIDRDCATAMAVIALRMPEDAVADF